MSRQPIALRFVASLLGMLVLARMVPSARAGFEKRVPPIPREQVTAFEKGDKVAVVVGVGSYPARSGLNELKYAAGDAEALTAELKKHGYLVTLLRDADATRPIVLKALSDAGAVISGPDSTVLFFFSGHGFEQSEQNYLATYEAFLEDLTTTGLSLSSVQDRLKATGARRQVLLVDACRNDAGSKAKSAGLRRFSSLAMSTGMRALFSTKAGSVSYESDALHRGVFTHFLLKGLRGEASGSDGLVTFHDLAEYVTAGVRAWGFERGEVQVPYESTGAAEASGDFLLAGPGAAPVWKPEQHAPGPTVSDATSAAPVPAVAQLPDGLTPKGSKIVRVKDGMAVVRIRAGTFRMGSEDGFPNERPVHPVLIKRDFFMDQHEVTVGQYRDVMGVEPPGQIGGTDTPVVMISWGEAKRYCETVGSRLPTEAEWEYAARGGREGQKYPWGNEEVCAGGRCRANVLGTSDGYESTSPVCAFGDYGYGLCDMAGNVYEWVSDWYGPYSSGEVTSPRGPSSGESRVMRGGSRLDRPSELRVACRSWVGPSFRQDYFGVRCARDSE